ncbi:hypothetical protein GGR52DRAFT_532286 [Hypoxylon sp. FL1284]|nr:hypothetical protein GGR52DRAFT_532286 [Hypoxylon sp. FL1284]
MARKKHQTRLTFEPVAASSSPDRTHTLANVRYSNLAALGNLGYNGSSSKQAATLTRGHAKKTHSKLQDYSGPSRIASSPAKPPAASFMPKVHGTQRAVEDSSDDELLGIGGADIKSAKEIPKSSQSVSTRLGRAVINDEDEDEEDDEPVKAPPSARKRGRHTMITLDSDSDSDDSPLVPPTSSKRRSRPAYVELNSSDSDVSPAKRPKTPVTTPGRLKKPAASASSPTKPRPRKGRRSEKQKKMELLRRRRAGEKLAKLTSSEDEGDEEKRGLYDTDPEDMFDVLKEFDDDDEEDELPAQAHKESPKKNRESRKKQNDGNENDDDDLAGFVTDDDDDAPLGAPANLDIPLEFTSQAIRPLKEQFPYAIEWLIHRRINPAFEREHPVYTNAWRKLDDEVRALASSKFASSAWKAEFYRALKGRPKFDAYEIDQAERSSGLYNTCEACGRSNHPATFRIVFHGHPYYKNTLDDVESDSEDSEGSGHASVDSQNMTLPSAEKHWHVGAVCCGNAETTSSLIHWKHALKDWVEERLEDDGWMAPAKLYERERMKARKRRDIANTIADSWRENGIIATLYRDFKNTLQEARNKSTSGRNKGRYAR